MAKEPCVVVNKKDENVSFNYDQPIAYIRPQRDRIRRPLMDSNQPGSETGSTGVWSAMAKNANRLNGRIRSVRDKLESLSRRAIEQ